MPDVSMRGRENLPIGGTWTARGRMTTGRGRRDDPAGRDEYQDPSEVSK